MRDTSLSSLSKVQNLGFSLLNKMSVRETQKHARHQTDITRRFGRCERNCFCSPTEGLSFHAFPERLPMNPTHSILGKTMSWVIQKISTDPKPSVKSSQEESSAVSHSENFKDKTGLFILLWVTSEVTEKT